MPRARDPKEKVSTASAGRWHWIADVLRLRYEPVTREKIPVQLWSLIEALKASGNSSKHDPKPSEQQTSGVTCPYCLGVGKRAGANAAAPVVVCPWCAGRGSLPSSPKPTEL